MVVRRTVHTVSQRSLYSMRSVITFRVSRRPREMYCGHARLCLCVCLSVCLSAAVCLHIARTRM